MNKYRRGRILDTQYVYIKSKEDGYIVNKYKRGWIYRGLRPKRSDTH